jgi:hypothetical protein
MRAIFTGCSPINQSINQSINHPTSCRERASKAKHVQLVSGAPVVLFWTANALWDFLQLSVSSAGIIALIAASAMPQYQGQRLAAVAALLLGMNAAGMSLTFLLQAMFTVGCCGVGLLSISLTTAVLDHIAGLLQLQL